MTHSLSEPLMTLWFGNFYRPTYDDRAFVDQAMDSIRRMGFNAVLLDSKAWADFQARYAGEEASPCVAQQEDMMNAAVRAGLCHLFLSLYLNGDNLYPNIRFSPPVYGESVTRPDGSDGRWYKYWSDRARNAQTAHVQHVGSHRGPQLRCGGEKPLPGLTAETLRGHCGLQRGLRHGLCRF